MPLLKDILENMSLKANTTCLICLTSTRTIALFTKGSRYMGINATWHYSAHFLVEI
jgi:hypothetical protein